MAASSAKYEKENVKAEMDFLLGKWYKRGQLQADILKKQFTLEQEITQSMIYHKKKNKRKTTHGSPPWKKMGTQQEYDYLKGMVFENISSMYRKQMTIKNTRKESIMFRHMYQNDIESYMQDMKEIEHNFREKYHRISKCLIK